MKRTPMKRSAPLRASGPARATVKLRNARKCKVCGSEYTPMRSIQSWCSPECGVKLAAKLVAKKAAKAAAEDRKQTRAQLEALKTIPQLKKEAQREVNRYVRARDRAAGYDCICCGQPLDWEAGRGGRVDAGHYRSTGSADHLRYELDNIHAQRVDCNRFGAGRAVDYRRGLLDRIGADRVAAIEENNNPVKWTRDGLREIRDTFRARANALEKEIK